MPQTEVKPHIHLDGCFERRQRITVRATEDWFVMPRGCYGILLYGTGEETSRFRGVAGPMNQSARPKVMPKKKLGRVPDRTNVSSGLAL